MKFFGGLPPSSEGNDALHVEPVLCGARQSAMSHTYSPTMLRERHHEGHYSRNHLLGLQKSNKTFRSLHKPIVDEQGNTTDDESKVADYLDDPRHSSSTLPNERLDHLNR